jgi:glycosyltransferase involved in cell wall biosynthesis
VSRLRILHVLQDTAGGGAAQALELAAHARRHEAEVVVVAPEGPVSVLELLLRAAKVDLLHVHGARAASWALPSLRLRPSVVSFHGLHPLRRPASRGYRTAARLLVRTVVGAADVVLCIADNEREELLRLGLPAEKMHLARNAVRAQPLVDESERRAARAELGLGNGELAVLVAGRLEPAKQPMVALEVAERLRDRDVVFLVAGDGALLPDVRASAGPNVRVLGHRRGTRALLAASDVVLSTSAWEGLPLLLLEAMWAGRPVVASDVVGNDEALGAAGLLVPPGEADAFAAAVLELRDAQRRSVQVRLGRERVDREFSHEQMLADTDRAYAAALGRSPW